MTPVYVTVIHFILSYFFCIRSLVRHLPNTSTGCFWLALFGKPRHWGQSECSSLIGWFLDMVYFQQWSRTESKTPHVTLLGRSYWISYIHTRSKKTKETKKLIYSIGNFLCNKIPCFCHHVESYQPSIFIISTKQNRSQYSWTVPSYSFCIKWNCGCDGTERGFTQVRLDLLRKEQNDFFLYLSSNWFSDNKHKLIFIEYQTTPIPHIKKATNCP